MSQFNEDNCGPEGLPLSVKRYIYRRDEFPQIIDFERERLRRSLHPIRTKSNGMFHDVNLDYLEVSEDVFEYVVFSIDNSTYNRDFLDPNNEPKLSIRTIFDQHINSFTIKMVFHEHEELSVALETAIGDALSPMGLKRSIYHYCSTTSSLANGSKQRDAAWGPRRPPPGTSRRSTVVVETAITETNAKLRRDVDRWLDPINGLAKIVLAIKADRRRPKISIERWQYTGVNSEIEPVQKIEITESSEGDEVTVIGGPLLIPF
ncbi:uncharacterized protein N7469_006655 [Penicillium citrinum]|uniref:Uncharacterized protein n=1 Tax=Penicillium citrinum TaxID=5077 RepID=A0A9W9NV09_PENCI|nr:uncharacterized protein N7469_006655 [Penicillium citrinum]KAJ5226649.1 hypothetical protein N7469_006655 [Penicillium citrinum]